MTHGLIGAQPPFPICIFMQNAGSKAGGHGNHGNHTNTVLENQNVRDENDVNHLPLMRRFSPLNRNSRQPACRLLGIVARYPSGHPCVPEQSMETCDDPATSLPLVMMCGKFGNFPRRRCVAVLSRAGRHLQNASPWAWPRKLASNHTSVEGSAGGSQKYKKCDSRPPTQQDLTVVRNPLTAGQPSHFCATPTLGMRHPLAQQSQPKRFLPHAVFKNGIPIRHGTQFAANAAAVSPCAREGTPQPHASGARPRAGPCSPMLRDCFWHRARNTAPTSARTSSASAPAHDAH